jgi:hypothetical protein
MPVYTLTCQLTDSAGQVRAVRQVPFVVLSPGQLLEQAAADLQQAAKDLEEAAKDLEEAARDESHPKHHWWRAP